VPVAVFFLPFPLSETTLLSKSPNASSATHY
jgi:hypothetical protein